MPFSQKEHRFTKVWSFFCFNIGLVPKEVKKIWLRILRHKRVMALSLFLLLTSALYIFTSDKVAMFVIEKLDWKVQSWAIAINGEPVFYLDSKEGALQALEMVKKRYLPFDYAQVIVEEVTFQEDVQVLAAKSYLRQLTTPERVAEIINQEMAKTIQYQVKSGDSLWTIARDNNITIAQLHEINPQLKKDFIQIGDNINLVKAEPLLTVVATNKTTVEEKIPRSTVYQNDAALRKGQQQIKQEGADGSRQVTYKIKTINGVETARENLTEKILLEPLSRIVVRGTKTVVASASRGGGGSGQLAWPLRGPITSPFGYRGKEFHQAIDIDGVTGNPVKAAGDGVVIFTGWDGNYGKSIVVDHGNGLTTRYSHLSEITVVMGDKIKRSSVIGRVGSTGRSTGSHLDFEVRVNGSPRNPLFYLK